MKDWKGKILTNKYFITVFIFIFWLLFLEDTNVFNLMEYRNQINNYQQAIEEYKGEIILTRDAIEELKDPVLLEKFARERYIMKKDNEDIYIIKSSIN